MALRLLIGVVARQRLDSVEVAAEALVQLVHQRCVRAVVVGVRVKSGRLEIHVEELVHEDRVPLHSLHVLAVAQLTHAVLLRLLHKFVFLFVVQLSDHSLRF